MAKKIVIGQRGWVFVGEHSMEGDDHVLTNASVIRRWGTSKGLGQLAAEGPTSTTVLDPLPSAVRVHKLAAVATIDVTSDKL